MTTIQDSHPSRNNQIEHVCKMCGITFYRRPSIPSVYCSHACKTKGQTRDSAPNFWSKVGRTESPDDCWPWQACISRDGYGFYADHQRLVRAHRFAYELTYGRIPKGKLVRHTCDNRLCCNPAHLIIGTAKDNSQDALVRGRHVRGETQGLSRFTESQVLEMRELYKQGMPQTEIARRFAAGTSTIGHIIHRRTWTHI